MLRFCSFALVGLATLLGIGQLEASTSLVGRWSGTVNVEDPGSGTTVTTPVQLVLEEKEGAVIGHITRSDENEDAPIHDAKLINGHFQFEVNSAETNGPVRFDLAISGDQMEGQMTASVDSDDLIGKVQVSRVK